MAIQLSTDYLAGMTDRSFAEIAIQTGYLSPEVLKNGVRGVVESEQVNKLLQNLKEEKNTAPTAPKRSRRRQIILVQGEKNAKRFK